MIRYTSAAQLKIEEFKTPFEIRIDKENRWVQLAGQIPWDDLAGIYHRSLSQGKGAGATDARIVIGAMILKHTYGFTDKETLEMIRENMYMQFFLGLSEYTSEEVFERSLFTTLRERVGVKEFDEMTCEIIKRVEKIDRGKKGSRRQNRDKNEPKPGSVNPQPEPGKEVKSSNDNHGKLMVDATVADQMIEYPTDLGLISRSRQESERIIDRLCEKLKAKKPRTYRRKARRRYICIAKKKHKTKREIRKSIGEQLRFLRRNLKSIDALLDKAKGKPFPLQHRDQKIYFVIQHIFNQQMEMYKTKRHSIEDRIVNIYQPYVRPIVRGKEKTKVEFGAKLGVSLQGGYARINTLSWDAYNEGGDLMKQVEAYKETNGYYPEAVIADKIYGTRENRQWLKERGIRFSGKPLGRPQKEQLSPYQKRKQKKEQSMRNQIEGKFGQGKNAYGLSKVRARTARTSESWIACILFVMNLIKFKQVLLWPVLKWIKKYLFKIFDKSFGEQLAIINPETA